MTAAKEKFDNIAGKICEIVLPIKHNYFVGRGKRVAICTLGSIDLLEEISRSSLLTKVALAGRLLSENRGIDAIIQFAAKHPELEHILICGKEVKGHMAGQALVSLHKNGVDNSGRIIGARGPHPFLKSTREQIESFRKRIEITDMTGITDLGRISLLVA